MQEINDGNFESEVLNESGTVLVDYYSTSCAPCMRLMPKLESVADKDYAGKIVKVNVEENFESSMRNQVKTIPTLVLYKDGEVVDTFRGCSQMSEEEITDLITS